METRCSELIELFNPQCSPYNRRIKKITDFQQRFRGFLSELLIDSGQHTLMFNQAHLSNILHKKLGDLEVGPVVVGLGAVEAVLIQ
jgi:hypothetical protein